MASAQPLAAKRKVLLCAFACGADPATKFFGGGDTMAWNLIPRLGRAHRLWVLTAAQNRNFIHAERKSRFPPDVHFVYVDLPPWLHRLLSRQGGIQLYAYIWQWRAYFVARRLHRKIGFDVFHHLTYDNDWMASPTGALLPTPYLRGPGGGAHRTPPEFARRYPTAKRWAERVRSTGQWMFRHDPFFIIGQTRAKAILVGNQEAIDAVPKKWRPKARLFPLNGVPAEAFPESRARSDSAGRFRIVTAGRLVRLKGFDLAIRAFARFAQRARASGSPPDAIELCVFGEGPERERLNLLARNLGVGDSVRFSGWKQRAELWAEMRASDVFLFPSLRDGGGFVVVEAMAAGNAIVCLAVGGPGMHVTPACGIKVNAESPEQAVFGLSSALETLYGDPELRRTMGSAARKRAEQFYHWDALAVRLLKVYEDVFDRQAQSHSVAQVAHESHIERLPGSIP